CFECIKKTLESQLLQSQCPLCRRLSFHTLQRLVCKNKKYTMLFKTKLDYLCQYVKSLSLKKGDRMLVIVPHFKERTKVVTDTFQNIYLPKNCKKWIQNDSEWQLNL